MACLSYVFFEVLINGFGSSFLNSFHDIHHRFPLYPYLFFLVVDGIIHAISEETRLHTFHGIQMCGNEHLKHLLSIYDILLFYHYVEAK
jgi:hypothetical protein